MKIASWNVNSIRQRTEHLKKWMQDVAPDVVFLQELKSETFPAEEFAGSHILVKGQKAYNGVAILSARPATLIHDGLPGNEDDPQARYLEADIEGVRHINIYLPNGNPIGTEKYAYKLLWIERLYQHLKNLRADRVPFLIGGDFNIIPEDKDCYDPSAWSGDALFYPDSRRKFTQLLSLGLTDAFRVFNQDEHQYSFWDYQAGAWQRDLGIRIDHFLTSPEITDRLQNCTIDRTPRGWDKASDHTPVIVEIN